MPKKGIPYKRHSYSAKIMFLYLTSPETHKRKMWVKCISKDTRRRRTKRQITKRRHYKTLNHKTSTPTKIRFGLS
jgi:hypothetical protein